MLTATKIWNMTGNFLIKFINTPEIYYVMYLHIVQLYKCIVTKRNPHRNVYGTIREKITCNSTFWLRWQPADPYVPSFPGTTLMIRYHDQRWECGERQATLVISTMLTPPQLYDLDDWLLDEREYETRCRPWSSLAFETERDRLKYSTHSTNYEPSSTLQATALLQTIRLKQLS